MKLIAQQRALPVAERRHMGKSRRRVVPRLEQARWAPNPGRPDPVGLLARADRGRLPELLPIKYGRMAASPFGFFRGAAAVMASDIGRLPVTGLVAQLCGDAHVRNLGAYAAPDGHLVFDINDFDETLVGPWEWDLKRLAVSLVLAGREAGVSDRFSVQAVSSMALAYREAMHTFAEMPVLSLLRYQIRRHLVDTPVHSVLLKARRATPPQTLAKLTKKGRGGIPAFRKMRPLLFPVSEATARKVLVSLRPYREELDGGHRHVFDAYRPVDVAFKVVGTGSVGMRDYVVLLLGSLPNDALFLQVKEEGRSCWAPYLRSGRRSGHEGQRVAEGQHALQTLSDPLLGWTTIEGRPCLVRQLSDHKASVGPGDLDRRGLVEYALVCGEAFAKGHARTGDAVALSGYLGTTNRFDRALGKFAIAYADQTEADFRQFLSAVRRGLLRARRGS
jgi:uncharacterized protein (DUF2252 family)